MLIINNNILNISNQEISSGLDASRLSPYRVIANIPYQITGKIVKSQTVSQNEIIDLGTGVILKFVPLILIFMFLLLSSDN